MRLEILLLLSIRKDSRNIEWHLKKNCTSPIKIYFFCNLTVSSGVDLPAGHWRRQYTKVLTGRPEALQRYCVRPFPQHETAANQLWHT